MKSKVIVIGAGFAGLSTAVQLKKSGMTDFLILEARGNIGGRVQQIKFCGSEYSIGPEWLHGQTSNPIFHLAKAELGLKVKDSEYDKFYFTDPSNLSVSNRQKLFNSKFNNLRKAVDERLANFSYESLENKSISEVLKIDTSQTDTLSKFINYWAFNFENGVESEKFSALVYKMSSDIYNNVGSFSDFHFVENNGFVKIINYFRASAGLNDKNIRFNDRVEELICDEDKIKILTKNGKEYLAEYCICTIPISVIGKSLIKIQPDFSNEIYETIGKLKFSTYSRVFIELSKPNWINNYDWLVHLSDHFEDEICLWKNPNDNPKTLIGHIYNLSKNISYNLERKIEISLKHILGNDYSGINSFQVICLENSSYSFGSFPTASSEFNMKDVENLISLNNSSRLLFAGDSYSLEYFGTVQGAFNTGVHAANTVLSKLYS